MFNTLLYSWLSFYNTIVILTKGKYCNRDTPNPQYLPLLTFVGSKCFFIQAVREQLLLKGYSISDHVTQNQNLVVILFTEKA